MGNCIECSSSAACTCNRRRTIAKAIDVACDLFIDGPSLNCVRLVMGIACVFVDDLFSIDSDYFVSFFFCVVYVYYSRRLLLYLRRVRLTLETNKEILKSSPIFGFVCNNTTR